MDFTELYKHSANLCLFSPSSDHILTASADRLIIRLAATLQIIRTWALDGAPSASASVLSPNNNNNNTNNANLRIKGKDAGSKSGITNIGWSCDGKYVMACLAGKGVVEIRSAGVDGEGEEWSARVEAGVEGLAHAEWAPDGRSILCWSEWGIRLTIHSLTTGQSRVIPHPSPTRAHVFRPDGRYLALATRRAGKDILNVHDAAENWALVRQTPLPTTSVADLSISPDGLYIAAWESVLEYKLHILTLDGRPQQSFSPPGAESALGVRSVAWHPSAEFVAVGGWDDKIYVLAKLADWKAVATLDVQTRFSAGCGVNVFREPLGWLEATLNRGLVQYDQPPLPLAIPTIRPDPSRVPLRAGPAQLSFSPTGAYLLARSDTTPTALHIFSFPPPSLPFAPRLHTVLLHDARVFAARWNPAKTSGAGLVAVGCEGRGAVYMWGDEAEWEGEGEEGREGVAECCGVPARRFELRELGWARDGRGMLLFDRETFCCAFEVQQE